jgi:hypothetical protein
MRRRASLFAVAMTIGCAGGGGARQPDDGTESESVGSEEDTADTIDPTMFSTSVADSSSSAPTTTAVDTSDDSSGADESTTVSTDGPTVVGITPADDATGIAADTSVLVGFSATMDPSTIVADTGDCTGTIQLSQDDFASCLPLVPKVDALRGDTSFRVHPQDGFDSAQTITVRVTTAAQASDGTPLQAEFTSGGFTSRYFHTIEIDGVDDWNGDEGLATSTEGHVARVAWDDTHVYVGIRSPDVMIDNANVWFAVYFGGEAGAPDGVLYNTQQPALPFTARWHMRWRADNIYTDVLEWDGDAWAPGGWTIGEGDVYRSGDLLEMRVARSDLDDPQTLELHLGLLRETMFDEATWAACPEGSYVDGYDPEYTQYWSFDLSGSDAPGDHDPFP